MNEVIPNPTQELPRNAYRCIAKKILSTMGSYKSEFELRLISTPAVKFWNLGVEFSKFEMLNSTPKFQNSTAGVEISHFEFRLV